MPPRNRPQHKIALVNHAKIGNPEHWAPSVSVRRSRAIKQTLKLRREGNRFAMLFITNADGSLKPLSTRQPIPSIASEYRDPNVNVDLNTLKTYLA